MRIFVSFDFDRTLADYSRAHGNSILDGIHESYDAGYVNWFDIDNHGLTDIQIIANLVHNHGISYHEIFDKMNICLANIENKFDNYSIIYPTSLFKNVVEMLENLYSRDNVFLGISTGNIKSINLKKTEETYIDEFFTFGSYGDEVFNRYQLLQLTKKRLNRKYKLNSKDLVFHIGDSTLDILSALKSGFIPVGVASGNYSNKQLKSAGSKYVFNNISEFYDNFDNIIEFFQKSGTLKPLVL